MLEQSKRVKWQPNITHEVKSNPLNGVIKITEIPGAKDTGLMSRCVVGYFRKEANERPTLADIKRWASASWRKAFGVNVYDMARNLYLFEFPNRYMAEQIIQGEWRWKNQRFCLEWWNLIV